MVGQEQLDDRLTGCFDAGGGFRIGLAVDGVDDHPVADTLNTGRHEFLAQPTSCHLGSFDNANTTYTDRGQVFLVA